MTRALAAALLCLCPIAASIGAEAPRAGQMINLSCVEALVSVDRQNLAGVFSFVPEKDGPAAFADLLVHDVKALKKFVAKDGKDLKAAGGISSWDHDALQFVIGIYDSPLVATLEKPSEKLLGRIHELAAAPIVTLDQLSQARRKG